MHSLHGYIALVCIHNEQLSRDTVLEWALGRVTSREEGDGGREGGRE